MSRLIVLMILLVCIGCQKTRPPAVAPGHQLELRMASVEPYADWIETEMRSSGESVYLDSNAIATGPDFERIRIGMDEKGRPCLNFQVTPSAAVRLATATRAHLGRQMAIVIDGVPELSLYLNTEFGANFQITGEFSFEEIDRMYVHCTGYD